MEYTTIERLPPRSCSCKYHKPVHIPGSAVFIPKDVVPLHGNDTGIQKEKAGAWGKQSRPFLSLLIGEKRQTFIKKLKRTLSAWPTCADGGTINVEWHPNGRLGQRAFFVCSNANKKDVK